MMNKARSHAEIFRGVYGNTAIFEKIISLLIPEKFSKKYTCKNFNQTSL